MDIIQKIIELLIKIFSRKNSASLNVPTSPHRVVLPTPPPDRPSTPIPPSPEPTMAESATPTTQNPEQPIILENTGFLITVEQLKQIVPTLQDSKCREYLLCLLQIMNEFSINTPLRVAAFIAQTAHESSGYTTFIENLNYSAQRLLQVFPHKFTQAIAINYDRQSQKIANYIYANKIGNGDEASDDGWRYKGRGVIQVTGRSNYKACGTELGLDLIAFPELLEQPLNAFRSAGWYWKSRNCNALADSTDFIELTRAINGGLNGLDDRKAYYGRAKSVFGIM